MPPTPSLPTLDMRTRQLSGVINLNPDVMEGDDKWGYKLSTSKLVER